MDKEVKIEVSTNVIVCVIVSSTAVPRDRTHPRKLRCWESGAAGGGEQADRWAPSVLAKAESHFLQHRKCSLLGSFVLGYRTKNQSA